MRKRSKRDLFLLVLLVVIGAGTVYATSQFRRGSLKEEMEKYRHTLERQRSGELSILRWEDMRAQTKGGRQEGADFDEEFTGLEGETVNVVGFMTPLYKFTKVNEFMLLPVPIECYFCMRPPLKDILYVSLADDKAVQLAQEPVIINGKLALNDEPGLTYFYEVHDARIGPAKKGGTLTMRQTSQEARQHAQAAEAAEKKAEEELRGPEAPPDPSKAVVEEDDATNEAPVT